MKSSKFKHKISLCSPKAQVSYEVSFCKIYLSPLPLWNFNKPME